MGFQQLLMSAALQFVVWTASVMQGRAGQAIMAARKPVLPCMTLAAGNISACRRLLSNFVYSIP